MGLQSMKIYCYSHRPRALHTKIFKFDIANKIKVSTSCTVIEPFLQFTISISIDQMLNALLLQIPQFTDRNNGIVKRTVRSL